MLLPRIAPLANHLRTLSAALVFGLLLPAPTARAAPPVAPAFQNTVPDQIFVVRTRRGETELVSHAGVVTKNELSGVELQDGSKTSKYDAAEVQRVVFGDVPPSYRDGLTFFARGDYENAAARFQVAATDASARPVVQAAARLAAGESFLRWGAKDPAHFSSAADELTTFFAEYPENRQLPKAEALHARALWLGGNPANAGSGYRALFEELSGTEATTGYKVIDCLNGGMQAARAMFAAHDTLGARETLTQLESALDAVIAGLGTNGNVDEERQTALETLRGEARIARDGFAELFGGNLQAAKNFFENQYSKSTAEDPAAIRFSVYLGLGEVRRQEGELREAELLFATVAALDHSSRDRIAEALLKQALCARDIADSESAARFKQLATSVVEQYGDTPAAREARALLPE